MSKTTTWPLVAPNDDGIRPAGKPDECFYCQQKVGTEHSRDCSVVTKKVVVRYIIEMEIDVPHQWAKEDLEFHRNDGTWCANNLIDELSDRFGGDGVPCMCDATTCEFVRESDTTPTRKLREKDKETN